MSRPKYRKACKIESLAFAVRLIEEGEFLYFNDKITHPAWAMSMPLRTIWNFARRGHLWLAVKREGNS